MVLRSSILGLSAIVVLGAVITLGPWRPAARSAMTGGALLTATPSPAATSPVPEVVRQELAALPPGTILVPCLPGMPVLSPGVRPFRFPSFEMQHPAFRYLSDGYCADDPVATPLPFVVPTVDP